MFRYESEMLAPVSTWLEGQGMMWRAELQSPWGRCDLVGCRIDGDKAEMRLALKQRGIIPSEFHAYLLGLLPDREYSARGRTIDGLVRHMGMRVPSAIIDEALHLLESRHFVVKTASGSFQKRNGWVPLFSRLTAIELKLSSIRNVLGQASLNKSLAAESYAALPEPVATRAAHSYEDEFLNQGVGLLSVTPSGIDVLIESVAAGRKQDSALALRIPELFWKSWVKATT